MAQAELPAWAHLLPPPSEEEIAAKMLTGHHNFPGDYLLEAWLWRYLRGLSADELAWLSSPAVRVERRYEYPSGTEWNSYWGHHWSWTRTRDGHEFAHLKVTTFFRNAHSRFWVDDGTEDLIQYSDVDGMVAMWKKAIARNK